MPSRWFCVCLAFTASVAFSYSQEPDYSDNDYLISKETSPLCSDEAQFCTNTACWAREVELSKCGIPPEFQDATECSELDCGIKIEAYRIIIENFKSVRTGLNITFPNNSSSVWFLFNRTDSTIECHHITANKSDSNGHFNLFYDCRRDIISEGIHKTVSLTVIASKKIFRGMFRIPSENELKNGSVFFYYHEFRKVPTITFQMNKDSDEYDVAISKHKETGYSKMFERLVNVANDTSILKTNTLITVEVGKPLLEGGHKIEVAPKDSSPENTKYFSHLEFIIIESSSSAAIIAAIVIMVILIVGFIVPLLIRWQQDLFLKPISGKMLLAFDPVSVNHTDVVQASRLFLQELLAINVMLDVTDVPKTEHKDPALWYQNAMEDVSFVAVVVPPNVAVDAAVTRGSPYQQTLPLCLDLVEKRWKNILNNQTSAPRDGCVLILLDDSDEKSIPELCRFWPKFHLPKQAPSLRQHLQSQDAKKGFRIRLPPSLLPRSEADDERFDRILREIKSQRCQPMQVISDAQQMQQTGAGDSSGQGVTKEFQDAYGLDVGIGDIKLIDDSSSSHDEEDLSGDEATNLQPESTQWKLY